ncbi:hypothetical protein OG205_35765 [Lentzea sp. NBC_00516]|uniref:hypothetical protein n=1 Tax=Lentzea sp. NBC_00516 TaxID=2903582 RepID=UPI002E80F09E|nr:hypothetical protein [Lentzea sp. NBC_00516]WUD23374.1 hypothetical protein OG205_35765 [Lentzea sp. NBC_00516]
MTDDRDELEGADADDLEGKVNVFAEEISTLLNAVFDDVPSILVERHQTKRVVRTESPVPLRGSNGAELGNLDISLWCQIDATKKYLAVFKSYVKLGSSVDRIPLIRWEYERDAHSKPCAHIQVHAHRGALSHLLSKTGHSTPHSMESLHLPVGGARFRPALEDLIEFLIRDCKLSAKPGWRDAVLEGRERWRRYQARTVVRDMAAEAADVLRGLGYTVLPPPDGDRPDSLKALQGW